MDKIDLTKITSGDHSFDTRERDIIDKGTLRINDYIAPDALVNEPTYMEVGNRFIRTIMITGYPRTSHIGWLNRLYSYGANIDISMHIEPLATNKVIKTLNRKISQYISTQRMDEERGKITDIAVDAALEDAEDLREKLQKGIEKFYYQSVYITINAKNLDELDAVTEEVEGMCGNIGMNTRIAMYQQTQGFHTALPLADDRLRFRRNFDSSSLATCFPFVSAELTNMNGFPILYGINIINGSLVMFDRFELPNYNSVVLATSGAGKSYFVKLEAIRYMSIGTRIMIIDPQGEYKRIAEVLGGQYFKLSSSGKDRINPFDLHMNGEEEEDGKNFLTQKILDVYSIVEVMLRRQLDSRERKVLLSALEETYKRFGVTREAKEQEPEEYVDADSEVFRMRGAKKKMPTLVDLEKALRRHPEGTRIADDLHPYVHGFLNLFNGETTIDTDSHFLVFDISEMENELADVAMFVVLEFLWGKIKSGDKKRRLLIVDEAWMMMNNTQSAQFMVRVAKTARKFFAGITMISQQARDFLTNGGEAIIGNTSMQVLLRQHPNDIKYVADMFGLSQSEIGILRNAANGEALIFAGRNHTAVHIDSHMLEHALCSTDPNEREANDEYIRRALEEEEEDWIG